MSPKRKFITGSHCIQIMSEYATHTVRYVHVYPCTRIRNSSLPEGSIPTSPPLLWHHPVHKNEVLSRAYIIYDPPLVSNLVFHSADASDSNNAPRGRKLLCTFSKRKWNIFTENPFAVVFIRSKSMSWMNVTVMYSRRQHPARVSSKQIAALVSSHTRKTNHINFMYKYWILSLIYLKNCNISDVWNVNGQGVQIEHNLERITKAPFQVFDVTTGMRPIDKQIIYLLRTREYLPCARYHFNMRRFTIFIVGAFS